MQSSSQASLTSEITVRVILAIIFYITDDAVPYYRKIQPEEYWLYRFPRTQSYYPGTALWITIFSVPVIVIAFFLLTTKDKVDAKQALLGVALSIFLTGSVTNCVKLGVGRPRPDFLARCFPDGVVDDEMKCTGNEVDVIQGYKSFPSGHSSFAFSSLGFVALYIAGKLHCFNRRGRGNSLSLCFVVIPLVWATMIAVSRTADFHHHWQDVTVGSILGLFIAYVCYRQYYPDVSKTDSHIPYVSLPTSIEAHLDTPHSPLSSVPNKKTTHIDSLLKIV